MNVTVGPSMCFGFDFKVKKEIEEREETVNDEPINSPPGVKIDVEIIKSEVETKVDNIIDSLKSDNTEEEKVFILEKAINENTIGLTIEKKNKLLDVLTMFLDNLDNPKLREILVDLYK